MNRSVLRIMFDISKDLVFREMVFQIIHKNFDLVTGDLATIFLIPFNEDAGHLLHVNPCQVGGINNT